MSQYEILNAEKKIQENNQQHYGRRERQILITQWAKECFGEKEATNITQRALRLFEETTEACQASNCDLAQLHKLLDYVYSRPVGNLYQELGGVGITTLLLAQAANLSAEDEEIREFKRIESKSPEIFRKRNDEKNKAGFLAKELK